MTKWGNKGSFGNIKRVESNLLVRRPEIKYRKDSRTLSFVNQNVSVWNGKVVLNGLLFESSESTQNRSFSCFLWQKAQEQPMGRTRTNVTLGEKFMDNFLNLIGLQLEEYVGAREKGFAPGSKSMW